MEIETARNPATCLSSEHKPTNRSRPNVSLHKPGQARKYASSRILTTCSSWTHKSGERRSWKPLVYAPPAPAFNVNTKCLGYRSHLHDFYSTTQNRARQQRYGAICACAYSQAQLNIVNMKKPSWYSIYMKFVSRETIWFWNTRFAIDSDCGIRIQERSLRADQTQRSSGIVIATLNRN